MPCGAEAGRPPWRLGQRVRLLKSGLNTLHNAQLRQPVAGRNRLPLGRQIGEDHLQLAAVPGVDHAGKRGQAPKRKAGAILHQRAVLRHVLHQQLKTTTPRSLSLDRQKTPRHLAQSAQQLSIFWLPSKQRLKNFQKVYLSLVKLIRFPDIQEILPSMFAFRRVKMLGRFLILS